MNDQPKLPALNVGGVVSAIIPQSVEEMWRVGTMVVRAGLAPQSLTNGKAGDEAVSAVCTAIMAGAELGLPPMVSLRSFTVIGGKPALYGDGIINVVRRSGKAAYLRTGYDEEKRCGWCEAKRSDTGEEGRVEFTIDDAKQAGLWDERETVRRKGRNNEWYDAKNDAPWHRYWKRMLAWRAAGYLLRELFADVLGGVRDEFEAMEIAGVEIDHSEAETPRSLTPPSPPSPPSPSKTPAPKSDAIDTIPDNGFDKDQDAGRETADDLFSDDGEGEPFDVEKFLSDLDTAMATGKDDEQIIQIWDNHDVEATLTDDEAALQRAFDMRSNRLALLSPVNGG